MSRLFDRGPGGALSKGYYGGSTGSAYRRMEEDYNRAIKQLRHAARRGDKGSSLELIKVRDEAMNRGIATGGILDRAERTANRQGFISAREQAAADQRAAEAAERAKVAGEQKEWEDYMTEEDSKSRQFTGGGRSLIDRAGVTDRFMTEEARGRYQSPLGRPAPVPTRNYDPATTPPGGKAQDVFSRQRMLQRYA